MPCNTWSYWTCHILRYQIIIYNETDDIYSRLPVTGTLYNSNLPLTRSYFHFSLDDFLYNFTLYNSNFFLFPLKVRIIGSRLYL